MPVALVTGGGSGIGRAAALALAKRGFRVVVSGRRRAPLEEVAMQLPGGGAWVADVADEQALHALFAFVQEEFGGLDLLFNNAGTGMRPTPVAEISLAEWKRVMDVNLTGAFLAARAAFRLMQGQGKERGGRIINNGSLSAHVPRPLSTAYTVSKHAMTGLTKALALEGRAFGIACGQIDIGNAATDITDAMEKGVLQADGRVAPEPRIAVEIVGEAVAHMASLPLEANIQFMTVLATTMPSFIGRG